MAIAKYTVLDVAAEVLKRAPKPLTPEQIWEIGKQLPMASTLGVAGRPPGHTLGARLLIDTRDNPRTRFMKLGRDPTRFWLLRRRAELTDSHFLTTPTSKAPPKPKKIAVAESPVVPRRAAQAVVSPAAEGAVRFLGRICAPVAAEVGRLLQDPAREWRVANIAGMIRKAEQIHRTYRIPDDYRADPRLVGAIVEHGSWTQDDMAHGFWGGLLSSSCCKDGTDDSNLVWIDLLARLAVSQVRLLEHVCQNAPKHKTAAGWLAADRMQVTSAELVQLTGVADLHRVERELVHLCSLGLLEPPGAGFVLTASPADLTPTSLALHFFTRGQGFVGHPVEYFRRQGVVADAPAT